MEQTAFDAWTRRRFATAASGLSALVGLGLAERGMAKKKKKKKKKAPGRCWIDGTSCGKEEKQCQAKFCLHAPFTIEAVWTNDGGQGAYLVVPPRNAATGPGPYLNFACNDVNSPKCGTAYPFACINEDQVGPGDGVTTVHTLLSGAYEYWIQLNPETDEGELTITLRDKGGRVVQEWEAPANPSDDNVGWHVFDIDGKRGAITSVDDLSDQSLPKAARDPYTFVCGN